jgi:hypothetical protein
MGVRGWRRIARDRGAWKWILKLTADGGYAYRIGTEV